MRRNLKNLGVYTFLSLICLVSGCNEDYLEVSNPNAVTKGNFYTNKAEVQLVVNSVYSSLQKRGLYGEVLFYSLDCRSDEATTTPFAAGGVDIGIIDFTSFNTPATNVGIYRLFNVLYNGIYRANEAIEISNKSDFLSEEVRNQFVGEALFLRAFYYFHAINLFGEEIPLYKKNPSSANDLLPKSAEVGAIWTAIEEDLIEAKSKLKLVEEIRGTADLGRATKGAATALLAKAYLFQEKWQLSADESAEIINGMVGSYALTTNYRDNFTNEFEHNIESIFEVGFSFVGTPNEFYNVDSDNRNTSEGTLKAKGAGMRRDIGRRWWNERATQRIYDEYERDGGGNVIDPRCFMTLWCPNGAKFYDANLDGAASDSLDFTAQGWLTGEFGWRKYEYDYDHWDLSAQGENLVSDINFRVLRYGDVLLMHAEAIANGAGGIGTAESHLNSLRSRANNQLSREQPHLFYANQQGELPTVQALMTTRGWGIMEAVRHERMVEMAGEQSRWYDLKRWGILAQTIENQNFNVTTDDIYPIPQQELDTNPNMKPNRAN